MYICEQSMKKFIGTIILSFMFCNISVAEDDKKFLSEQEKIETSETQVNQ